MESNKTDTYIIDVYGILHKVPANVSQYEYAKQLQKD